jgi:hypothetical protein
VAASPHYNSHRNAKPGRSLSTFDILTGLLSIDDRGDWSWIQVHTQPIVVEDAARFSDSGVLSMQHWDNTPLTREAAAALATAAKIARSYQLVPIPLGVLALGILSRTDFGAAQAFLGNDAASHQSLLDLVQDTLLGTRLMGLERLLDGTASEAAVLPVAQVTSSTLASTDQSQPNSKPKDNLRDSRQKHLGFVLGTFVGAVIIAIFGGLRWGEAIGLAVVVQIGAASSRQKRMPQRFIRFASLACLLVAVVLALTAHANLETDRQAMQLLNAANADIQRGDLPAASKNLAGADLLVNQSITVHLLAACVEWDMGFRDDAALDSQGALNLGYQPSQASGYRGRDCFLDAAPFRGISFMKIAGFGWVIYTQPGNSDRIGDQFLLIAQENQVAQPDQAFVALGCLDDRYDFRILAGTMLTLGLNENVANGGGALPSAALRICLQSASIRNGYRFFTDPGTSYDVYVPSDFSARIPSPSKPHPPAGVCWAEYPAGGPCNGTP